MHWQKLVPEGTRVWIGAILTLLAWHFGNEGPASRVDDALEGASWLAGGLGIWLFALLLRSRGALPVSRLLFGAAWVAISLVMDIRVLSLLAPAHWSEILLANLPGSMAVLVYCWTADGRRLREAIQEREESEPVRPLPFPVSPGVRWFRRLRIRATAR